MPKRMVQNNQVEEILESLQKKAIFGMKRRAAARNADPEGVQQEMAAMRARGMNPQQMNQEFENRHLQREEERKTFDRDMSNMQAQRNNPLYSMSPQGRNAALGRSVDQQLLQEKVDAQNQQVQNIQKERALAQQMRTPDGPEKERAFAQQMHTQDGSDKPKGPAAYNPTFARTVDRNMGVSNEQIGRQQPQSQQQVAQATNQRTQDYNQAKADLVKMNPNLGVAGHEDNTKFIASLKSTYGDNYREHLQQNPQQLMQHYTSMQPQANTQQTAQNTQPAGAPAPTTAPATTPGQPVAATNLPQPATQAQNPLLNGPATNNTFAGKTSLSLGGSTPTPTPTPTPPPAPGAAPAQPTAQTGAPGEKKASLLKTSEEVYLSYVRGELKKMATVQGEDSRYSMQEIDRITASAEAFEKAASEEAQIVWNGFIDQLKKEGADQDFIDGFTKEAGGVGDAFRMLGLLARRPTTGLKSLGAMFRGGSHAEGIAKATPTLGGLVDAGGNVVRADATGFLSGLRNWGFNKGYTGGKRLAFADEFQKKLNAAGRSNAHIDQKIDKLRGSALDGLSGHLRGEADAATQQSYRKITQKASLGDTTAQQAIKDISSGNAKALGKEMNLPTSSIDEMGSQARRQAASNVHLPSESVIGGAQAHAGDFAKNKFDRLSANAYIPQMSPLASGAPTNAGAFRFSPGKAMTYGLGAGMLGSAAGPLGTAAGVLGGGLVGGLGYGGATTVGLGGAALGANALGLFGKKKKDVDVNGAPSDRHRVVPFMKNKYTGAIGGALLAHMIAKENGLSGPMSWLLPIVGGLAGHQFLPQMMNKWKDPRGYGENSIGSGAAMINQANPVRAYNPEIQ